MNEQLQGALAQLIEKTLGGIDAASGFLVAEMPNVIYQLLLWYGVKSLIMTGIALLSIPVYLWIEKKTFNMSMETGEQEVIVCGWGLAGMLARIPYFIAIYKCANLDWLQIWIAPKIWLLEYAANLAK